MSWHWRFIIASSDLIFYMVLSMVLMHGHIHVWLTHQMISSRSIKTMFKGMWAEFQGTVGTLKPSPMPWVLSTFSKCWGARYKVRVCARPEQQIAKVLLFRGSWKASSTTILSLQDGKWKSPLQLFLFLKTNISEQWFQTWLHTGTIYYVPVIPYSFAWSWGGLGKSMKTG